MTYQPAPYSQLSPTPTPRKKRHLVRNSVFAVIGVGIIIGIATSASSSKHADAPAKPASPGVSKGIAAKVAAIKAQIVSGKLANIPTTVVK